MSEYMPTTDQVRDALVDREDFVAQVRGLERKSDTEIGEGFDRWIAAGLRKAKAEGWEHAKREVKGIPHWWNSDDNYGEFDLQALGPNETTEHGAFMEVMRVLGDNPYRADEMEGSEYE